MATRSRIVSDGQELLSRNELARVTGERPNTLYRWWAARERNGHPEGVLVDGQPYFDLQQWQTWRADYGADQRLIDGRPHLTAAALSRATGEPMANLEHWFGRRATNGYPDAVRIGKLRYFDEAAWRRWYDQHKTRQSADLTEVDRAGNPNELIDTAEASRVLGYASPRVLTSYITRGQFLEPDETEELPSGRIHRRWARRRVWVFADTRAWARKPGSATTPDT